jgi:hypothetical protein
MPGKIKQTFIPNYGMVTYNSAEKVKKFSGFNQPAIMPPQGSKAGKNYKENFEKSHGFNPYAWNGYVPNFAAIPQNMSLQEAVTKNYSRSMLSNKFGAQAVNEAIGPSRKAAAKKVYATGQDFSILNIGNSDFDELAGKELAKAIQSIAMTLIKPNSKKLPSADAIIKQLQADTSAYPQILGRLFESSINAAINLDLNKKQGGGSGTWDYIGSNFASDKVNQSLFGGQLAAMQALPYLDAKLNAGTAGASIKGKIKRTPMLKQALIQGLQSGSQLVNLPYGVIKSTGSSKPIPFAQEDLASGGFIPNFAGLKEAIGREISAGVPASSIRVGASSSLSSNNNPLGLGVYNTKDEPRGLNQGINRYSSKSAARKAGAYGGYVPNFALATADAPTAIKYMSFEEANSLKEKMKGLATSVSKVKVYFDDNALPQSIQKYKGNLIQASIGLSLASGLLQEATKGSPKLSQAIEGFSSTLSLAGTAAQVIPGKFGVAGAALLAVTGTFGTIANLLKEKSTKLADKAEQSSQTLTDFSNSSQKYADILQKLQDAQKDPKTSSQTIGRLNEDLIKAAGQIPDAYRKQLVSITNYTDLLDQMSKIQSELANEEAYYKGASGFEEVLNKRTGTKLAQYAEALSFRPLFNPRESIGYGLTGSEMEKATGNISSKGFENNQARENLKRMLASGELDIFKTAGSATFNPKKLEELGLRKDAIESISRLAQEGGRGGEGKMAAQTLVQNVLTKLLEEVIGGEEAKKLSEQRTKEVDIINKKNAENQKSIDMEKSRQDALDDFYQRLIQIGDVQQEYKDKLAFNTQDVQLQRASGLLEYNRSSMGPQSSREYQNLIETAKQQLDFTKKYRDQETKARSDILQEGYKTFLDLKKENVPGQTPKVDVQKLNEFQTTLGQLATSGKSADQIGQEITNSFNQFFGGTAYGSKAIDLQTQANNILSDNQRALLDLNAQQIKQTELTKINNQIQAASIQKQRDVRSFGGLESYINPQSNSTIDSLVTNIQGLGTPVGGRASAGTLLDTVKMFGGSLEGVNLGSLKERAIAGRAKDIEFQTSTISKLLASKGEFGLAGEYSKIGARSGEIARTQVEEAIQSQRAILDINKNVSTISANLTNFTKAFTNPNQNTGLPNQPGANLQNTSQAVGNLTAGISQIQIKNTDLSLKGNIGVDIKQPEGGIEFTVNTDSIENIKGDITTQIEESLTALRTDLENQIKNLTNSFNERIVSVGGQRLPPTKK